MNSLFGPKSSQGIAQSPIQSGQNQNDPTSIVESALRRSGGDAKAAFYLAAREKGVDPDMFLKELESAGDMKSMAMKVLDQNPQMKKLASLFSMIK